jgi:hypothetical protein
MHRQQFFSRPFNRFGFIGVDALGGDQAIIIQQFQSAATTEPSEPAEKQNLRSATVGGCRLWSAGLKARVLDRLEYERQSIEPLIPPPPAQRNQP